MLVKIDTTKLDGYPLQDGSLKIRKFLCGLALKILQTDTNPRYNWTAVVSFGNSGTPRLLATVQFRRYLGCTNELKQDL